MNEKPKYVSLFSGAGGLDIGLERAGFKVLSMCEVEKNFCNTLISNQGVTQDDGNAYFSDSHVINEDIRDLSKRDLANTEVDLVVGGPPCQSFSSSGKQRSVLDARGELVNEFFRIINEIKPKVFIFENVRGLVTARDHSGEPGGVIKSLLNRFWHNGYSCRAILLNSADYGSYQRRVRCFIIGSSKGIAPTYPVSSHSKEESLFTNSWKSLEEFLILNADSNEGNYTYPTEALAQQLQNLPNGTGLKSIGKAEKTRPGGHWGYRQGTFIANLTLPARTVTGSSSQDWIRWEGKLRRLTLNEVKLLQGFPATWDICGTKSQVFKQIGNAVPTIFGELIGHEVLKHLNNFPTSDAEYIDIPKSFNNYIEYTKKDHAKNYESRSVHKQFELI